ncbi:hypothetical protein JS531_09230 [Bifidobacterium sp. CP2]|uniref:hypothetical protein n=1 Tax=Bifidobacterium sp. CP2 TaxID=2809025 RepID=UPI001BDD76EC|nr:hypothetical protein [Bifidobacterium sp. CP2]MBT1182123.1 hypothetical protein [Bifidobacterium sp. CP2]
MLISMLNACLAGYVAAGMPVDGSAVGKTSHALPADTVLRTDADFDAFGREVLGDGPTPRPRLMPSGRAI